MEKKWLGKTTLFLVILLLVVPMESLGKTREIEKLQEEFKKNVGGIELKPNYLKLALTDAARLIASLENESQYFLYVDRNPQKQIILVCYFDLVNKEIILIGADKTSTGNPKRKGHFITPIGIYKNQFIGYRALGAKNDQGWRGLGEKGSRVWDFGWQKTDYKNEKREIRLLLHATDPIFGEPRLGKIDSKGCIRISNKLNRFLDHYGLIDREMEGKVSWLFKKDRKPVSQQGKYLLVGDFQLWRK